MIVHTRRGTFTALGRGGGSADGSRSALGSRVTSRGCSARLVWWCWVCYARKILKIERAVASFCATSERSIHLKLQLSTNHLACHHVAVALDDA
jgi:hypothetical protein